MKKVRFQRIDHIVYDSVEEAQDAGISPYEGNWRQASPGDWVKTDEDPSKVLQVLARGAFWLRTCSGTYATRHSAKHHAAGNRLTAVPREYRYSLTGYRQGAGKKFSAKQRAMVMFFCQGATVGDLRATFLKVYKRSPGPNEWQMYCNSPKFWEAVSMELKQDMEEVGISKGYLLEKMKSALDSKVVKPKDLFEMAKQALELHEGRQPKGIVPLFGKFAASAEDVRFEEVEKKEIGDGKEKKLKGQQKELDSGSD